MDEGTTLMTREELDSWNLLVNLSDCCKRDWIDSFRKFFPCVDLWQTAMLSPLRISCQPVISATLNVQRYQIESTNLKEQDFTFQKFSIFLMGLFIRRVMFLKWMVVRHDAWFTTWTKVAISWQSPDSNTWWSSEHHSFRPVTSLTNSPQQQIYKLTTGEASLANNFSVSSVVK